MGAVVPVQIPLGQSGQQTNLVNRAKYQPHNWLKFLLRAEFFKLKLLLTPLLQNRLAQAMVFCGRATLKRPKSRGLPSTALGYVYLTWLLEYCLVPQPAEIALAKGPRQMGGYSPTPTSPHPWPQHTACSHQLADKGVQGGYFPSPAPKQN